MVYPIVAVRLSGSKLWDAGREMSTSTGRGDWPSVLLRSFPSVRKALWRAAPAVQIGPQSLHIVGEVAKAIW